VTRRLRTAALPVVLLVALAILRGPAALHGASGDPILVLVSFDGWRWDYAAKFGAPALDALAARGLRVRELIPAFPVLTFPNHYTIVTGLYPEHHGVVGNNMRDPAIGEPFSMSAATAKDSRWWGGEPLWVTAERHGLRTASLFWPGTEAEIGGVRPTDWRPFDGALTARQRVAQLIDWLGRPEGERPSFIMLYLDDADGAGHDHGPDSAAVRAAAKTLDESLRTIVDAVARLGLAGRTTIAVASDHGMAALSPSRTIWLDDYLDVSTLDVIDAEGVLTLAPRDGTASAIDAVFSRLHGVHPHLRVFRRETTPQAWHYRASARIAPIVGVPDAGWTVTSRERRRKRADEGRLPQRGTHGFDPADRLMHAIFVAAGPQVAAGLTVPSIENVQLYNFLCAVLRLEPAPNDGDAARVSAWIRRPPPPPPR
jgi:predicted AlkP superfamily pyrophosphatase or phosphodiesterase